MPATTLNCTVLSTKFRRLLQGGPSRAEYLIFGGLTALFWLLFAHPDLVETARHGYILIRSTLDGNFLGFFEDTFQRTYGYVYTNAAHYNILMYVLYAVWQLPLYLLEQLFGFACSDLVLTLWCKAIGIGFYLGCGFVLRRLAQLAGCEPATSQWVPLLFWLNPISFFTTVIMGQYDSICLFFLLLSLVFYLQNRLTAFSLMMGVGMVFKFFPLFVLVPLLLLAKKRPLRLVWHGICSLWLYLPTTLLFLGHTGDAAVFNDLMVQRLFAQIFAGGVMDASQFGLWMVVLCAAAYLYQPKGAQQHTQAALYGALAAFCLLFLFVYWHPQWLILLVPFALLTTLMLPNKAPFVWLHLVFCAGFFLVMAQLFPAALEGNLLDFGLSKLLTGLSYSAVPSPRFNGFYFGLIPYLTQLSPVLFYGPLFCELMFKLPLSSTTLAQRLGGAPLPFSHRLAAWGSFAALVGIWLVPTLFSYCKTFGFL